MVQSAGRKANCFHKLYLPLNILLKHLCDGLISLSVNGVTTLANTCTTQKVAHSHVAVSLIVFSWQEYSDMMTDGLRI
jgi:hypothetical protein